jgi:hypothetical protein
MPQVAAGLKLILFIWRTFPAACRKWFSVKNRRYFVLAIKMKLE